MGLQTLTTGNAGMYGFSVDMDPSPVILVAAFDKLGLDIRSFRVPLERSVREVMSPSLVQNFSSRGRPDAWAPLALDTIDYKAAHGFQGVAEMPLVRTGRLKKVAGQINLWKIDGLDGSAVIEGLPGDVWYGAIHQGGAATGQAGGVYRTKSRRTGQTSETTRGVQGYIPARPWAVIQDEDIDKIQDVFERWMDERIAGLVLLR